MSNTGVFGEELDAGGGTAVVSAEQESLRLVDLVVERGGRPVLHDVSLDIPAGEVTALLGPNGAGKSSLVLGVGGVIKPSKGQVLLGDTDITRRRPDRVRGAGVAVVPEGRWMLRGLTVAENLEIACYGLSRAAGAEGREIALEMFPELQKRLNNGASQLSGGEQQMLVLAQAIVSQPKYILIDELSLGLAPVIVQRLIPTVHAVAESGVGVLLIEQFAHVALELAERAYLIEGGRIQYSGTTAELKERPDLLQAAYLLGGAES